MDLSYGKNQLRGEKELRGANMKLSLIIRREENPGIKPKMFRGLCHSRQASRETRLRTLFR
jgi:hypothetical protein